MAIEVAGKRFVTLADEFFVNGAKVYEAWANGVQVYPEDGGLPEYIVVTQPPNKLIYSFDEDIDFTGIIVTAYYASGGVYGEVPFDELVFPETKAGRSEIVADLDEIIVDGVVLNGPLKSKQFVQGDVIEDIIGVVDDKIRFLELEATAPVYATAYPELDNIDGSETPYYILDIFSSESFRYKMNPDGIWHSSRERVVLGESVNTDTYRGIIEQIEAMYAPWCAANQNASNLIAYYLLYGIDPHVFRVPVQWARPEDGRVLEAWFEIRV